MITVVYPRPLGSAYSVCVYVLHPGTMWWVLYFVFRICMSNETSGLSYYHYQFNGQNYIYKNIKQTTFKVKRKCLVPWPILDKKITRYQNANDLWHDFFSITQKLQQIKSIRQSTEFQHKNITNLPWIKLKYQNIKFTIK